MRRKLLLFFAFLMTDLALFANGNKNFMFKKESEINRLVQMAIANENKKGHMLYMIGKERALTQKMAKEALLIALGVDVEKNREYLKESANLYERILNAVLKGDRELKINASKNKEIISFTKKLQKEWKKFKSHLKPFYEKNSVKKEDLLYIVNKNEDLLRDTNRLFLMYKKEDNFDNKLTDSMMNALDFAGRESMLSQKIVKEKLLVLAGIDKERNIVKLRGSFLLFDKALRGLLDGNEKRGISPAAVSHIRAELLEMKSIWDSMIPVIFKTELNREDLKKLVTLNLPLLDKSNKVVRMYEDLADLY